MRYTLVLAFVWMGCATTKVDETFDDASPAKDAASEAAKFEGGFPDVAVDVSAPPDDDASTLPDAGTPQDDTAEQLCVDTINQYRATLNLPPYQRWKADESCTDGQALADSISGVPHSAFGKCGEYAQNECPGWPGPAAGMIPNCLAAMWAEGPGDFAHHGHYVNMSSPSYTMVSCGFATAADGSIWATQDFK
jgi:hypothetical protein